MQNRGFSERKFTGAVRVLVKLQRPPPEMRIFSPGALAWSRTSTRRPRLPASMAHISPAAPAPATTTSYRCKAGFSQRLASSPPPSGHPRESGDPVFFVGSGLREGHLHRQNKKTLDPRFRGKERIRIMPWTRRYEE